MEAIIVAIEIVFIVALIICAIKFTAPLAPNTSGYWGRSDLIKRRPNRRE